MKLSLTPEQKRILIDILSWYKHRSSPFLTLGGYAGTGKTTLIAQLAKILTKLEPKTALAFCSYTGKATRVLESTLRSYHALRSKDRLGTIHSTIYAPVLSRKGKITGWRLKDNLKADLIILDEASMVDRDLWQDLLSFNLPILAVGDHGQLPPISGNFNLMEKPNLKLEAIHRQAAQSPIIKLSQMARENGLIPIGHFGPGVNKFDRYDSATGQEVENLLQNFNRELMVLCGYNHTRVKLNQQIRHYLEFDSESPRVGDRVICLKNNWEKGIYNGITGNLKKIIPVLEGPTKPKLYDAEVELDDGLFYQGHISTLQFNQLNTLDTKDHPHLVKADLFDFGYALTVHKAQGSQSPAVLLFEERNRHMNDDDWRRWLYTAVTRAETKLAIVGTA